MLILLIYLFYLVTMSFIAYVLYYKDKMKARKGLQRTPERTLLGFGFFGGAIGALIAMRKFRHKTRHVYFYIVNVLGIILQIALGVAIVYLVIIRRNIGL